ncbi:MAG TPA: hypothetical protein ENI23_05390 [bacterium]|nr:hypothetical protein [bacterium]
MAPKRKITDDERLDKVLPIATPLLKWFGIYQSYVVKIDFLDDLDSNHVGYESVARIEEHYPYRLITIKFQRKYIDDSPPHQIEGTIIHEILHPLIFGPVERYLTGRGMTVGAEFEDLQESLVDLIRIWLTRLRPEEGWN